MLIQADLELADAISLDLDVRQLALNTTMGVFVAKSADALVTSGDHMHGKETKGNHQHQISRSIATVNAHIQLQGLEAPYISAQITFLLFLRSHP